MVGRAPLTQVVFLDIADVPIKRAVPKDDKHDGAVVLQGDDVRRVANNSVLLLGFRCHLSPGLGGNVEHPQLAGHIPRRIYFSTIHVYIILKQIRFKMRLTSLAFRKQPICKRRSCYILSSRSLSFSPLSRRNISPSPGTFDMKANTTAKVCTQACNVRIPSTHTVLPTSRYRGQGVRGAGLTFRRRRQTSKFRCLYAN